MRYILSLRRTLVIASLIALITSCAVTRPGIGQIDPDFFVTLYPLSYETSDKKQRIDVPVGFVTDLVSIPRGLWWWESKTDWTMAPAIIHDFLYWEQSCSREEADIVMLLAMEEVGVSRAKREIVFRVLREVGQKAWENNRQAKAGGELRLVSQSYIPTLMGMPMSRAQTWRTGVYAQVLNAKAAYAPRAPDPQIKAACTASKSFYDTRSDL